MKAFLDTSVLVAAFLEDHVHHEPSHALLVRADKKAAACAGHSLAEVYSVLTRLPGEHRLSGEQALLFVEDVAHRLTQVVLDAEDYLSAIRDAEARQVAGGSIYDALLARCAVKARAETLYTWNLQHFRRLGPEIAARVRTP